MARLKGKVAVITGATSGIGRRTAEVFVEEGASVVLAGRREDLGKEIADKLGARACFIKTDVTKEEEIEALIKHAVDRFGRLDCLFNNAGGPAPVGSIANIPLAGYEAAMAVLVRSVFLGMKHAAPIMHAQRSGSIINNASVAALRAGLSFSMIYSAAKAAVIQMTVCVAMEMGESNVRVNCISPGGIATGIFAKALGLSGARADDTAEPLKEVLATMQPIPRAGLPDDIAYTAVFLAGDESTFINGQNLVVDGGLIGGRPWSQQQERAKAMREAFGVAADM